MRKLSAGSKQIKDLMDSFRRIVQSLRSSHRAAEYLNLTGAQLFVLATLGSARGPMGVKEMAEATGTDQSTISVVAGRLVDRGLVKRARSTVDTRRVKLSLTHRGRGLQRKAPATTAQTKLAGALATLSTSDAKALTRILGAIVEIMGEAAAPASMLFDEREANDCGGALRNAGVASGRRLRTAPKPRKTRAVRKK